MTVTIPSARPLVRAREAEGREFRPDIQALRTLAISAVVMNHLWPTYVPGGYVGVDVFFVISGFLITAHLMKEVDATGQVRLGAFYARRIRRLLPAALLVLAVSVVLTLLFLPYPRWERNATEIAASAGYLENWWLAHLSVNYSALNESASIVQHYWSLSVEEQFYLVWPALILAAVGLAVWAGRGTARRRAIGVMAATVLVLSFVMSVIFTNVQPSQAYFVTFTRAWEFAMGALVALLGARLAMSPRLANPIALIGFALISLSIFTYGASTEFPGWAALLPVAGTAAIIAAGVRGDRLVHSIITDRQPIQWLGGISYSLYLWHWPLIVVAPFVLKAELDWPSRLAVLALAIVLAWLTKWLVEDPARIWTYWRNSTSRSVGLMVVGMVVVIGAAGGLLAGFHARSAADLPTAPVATGSCDGPHALAAPDACANPFGPASTVYMTKQNEYFFYPPECGATEQRSVRGREFPVIVCNFAPDGGVPEQDVWIVGDSHAQQWQGAVFELAMQRGWRVTLAYRGHCPAADVAYTGFRSPLPADEVAACREWSRTVSSALQMEVPSAVFTAMASRLYLVDDGSGRSLSEQFADGLLSDWATWNAAGITVYPIADPPFNGEVRDPDCVLLNASDPLACARPIGAAQPSDPVAEAARAADDSAIRLIDLTDRFCDASTCYAVVGGVPVYYDADHLNLVYVRMLAEDFAAAMQAR